MNEFYNLSELSQVDGDSSNRYISNKTLAIIIKKAPPQRSAIDQTDSLSNPSTHLKEANITLLTLSIK